MNALILAGQPADPAQILAQYLEGKRTEDIAANYGVSRQALGHFLRQHAEEEWKQAQVILATTRKDDAEAELDRIKKAILTADHEERARLKLSLACAEKSLAAAQWDLERVCRRIYGDAQQPSVTAEQLGELLMAISTRMLTERQVSAIPAA